MLVVQRPVVIAPVKTSVETYNVKGDLQELIITPLRNNLNKLVSVLSKADASKQLIDENYNKIRDYRNRAQLALDQLKQATIQESIASLGLRGFMVKLNVEGIQIDLSSSLERQTRFFALLREAVFLYPRSKKWPPPLETGYDLFQYNSPMRENVCFFWPLYGFILRTFLDKHPNLEITDIFVLKKMRAYCRDPFDLPKKKEARENQSQRQLASFFSKIGTKPTNKEEEPQEGGEIPVKKNAPVEEKELPTFLDPLEEEEKRRAENTKKKEEEGRLRTIEDNIQNSQLRNPMVSSYSQQCDSTRFFFAKRYVQRSLVEWEMTPHQKINISEYDAMESIVVKYLQDTTKLSDGELLVGGKKGQTISDIYYELPSIGSGDKKSNGTGDKKSNGTGDKKSNGSGDKKYSKYISSNEPAITDPLLGVTYTWDNLIKWFGYPMISGSGPKASGKPDKENVPRLVKHLLTNYRSRYSLTSAMFKLDEKTLGDIRGRYLRFLEMIFTMLRDLYLEIEQKLETASLDISKERDLESRSREFMIRLEQEIQKSDDPSKRLRLEKIKMEASEKLKPFLS